MLHTSNSLVDVSESTRPPDHAGPMRKAMVPHYKLLYIDIYIYYTITCMDIYIYVYFTQENSIPLKDVQICSMYFFVRDGVTQSIEDQCLYSWLVLVRGCKLFVLYAIYGSRL